MIAYKDQSNEIVFLLVLSSDKTTGATGKLPGIKIRKPGGSFSVVAGLVSEIAYGFYRTMLTSSECNVEGPLCVHITADGCDPVDMIVMVVSKWSTFDSSTDKVVAVANEDKSGYSLTSGTINLIRNSLVTTADLADLQNHGDLQWGGGGGDATLEMQETILQAVQTGGSIEVTVTNPPAVNVVVND